VLARPSNLLILDEPTNDLDMETLELLQELVAAYPGTVILVSHDRDFLDRTVSSTIVPEGDGRWVEYAGGYSDMLAQRGGTRLDDRKAARARAAAAGGEASGSASKSAPEAAKGPAKKLSFKQKFALESLPGKMEAVSASISALENNIADPAFYERDPKGFQKTIAALDKERAMLAALEEEWLELEMLREELGG
jgi:ATP-binding cassette subfamily F protein uup